MRRITVPVTLQFKAPTSIKLNDASKVVLARAANLVLSFKVYAEKL